MFNDSIVNDIRIILTYAYFSESRPIIPVINHLRLSLMLNICTRISSLTITTIMVLLQSTNLSIAALLADRPTAKKSTQIADLPAREVITSMYRGMRVVSGDQGTPALKMINSNTKTTCGMIRATGYCPINHTVYITPQDVKKYYKYGDAALAFVIAHEYGHAMQEYGKFMPINGMMAELQADCLAGYYIGAVPNINFDKQDLVKIFNVAKSLGDYDFGSSQHHGTPRKRTAAAFAGLVGHLKQKSPAICGEKILPQAIDAALEKVPNF
jgi:uncharacterized protein